jgi:beta-galactosidase
MTLFNWEIYNLPLATPPAAAKGPADTIRPGTSSRDKAVFFKGTFTLDNTADTYFDLSGYKKGVIWVNGHNLGRYWYVGPQQHLYCPASWLKKGLNEIDVLDLLQSAPAPINGVRTLE